MTLNTGAKSGGSDYQVALRLFQVVHAAGTASCAGTHTPVETRENKPCRLKQEINHEDTQTQAATRLI